MNVSELHLHGVTDNGLEGERCHWCGATLEEVGRHRRKEPCYSIDGGRRILVEVELWACTDCADRAELLTDADRAELQHRLDDMAPPLLGHCALCDHDGEIFPHFDPEEGEDFLLCERCFFETP
jgi:hypothetical protein